MTDTTFEIRLSGEAASEAATEFRAILAEAIPEWSADTTAITADGDRRIDPALAVALVTLVIAVPSSLKDGLDLAERFKLGQRLKTLLERLQTAAARLEIDPGPFLILPGGFAPLSLDSARPDQILQALLSEDEKQEEK